MLSSHSPWSSSLLGEVAEGDGFAAMEAVSAASLSWRHSSWADRQQALGRLAAVLDARRHEAVELLIEEAGKNRTDAEAEAGALPRKIAITCEALSQRTPTEAAHSPGEPVIRWRARGPALVLGPFNFPLHLVNGLVVPALAVGATVVAKPSERCPLLGQWYGAALAEAGLGAVARVVSGGPDVAAAALQHPAVATVAAVGGRPLGLALAKALAARPEVVLALELGGVNQALVRPDADRQAAVAAVAEGAWRMAGQRCTATRIVHVPRADCALWLRELEMARESWWPGSGSGPMIDRQSRERFRSAYRQLGSGLSLCAGALTGGFGALQEPLLLECRSPSGRAGLVYREEHFGPALIVDPYDDEADVLQRMAANPYRLAASVFTQDHDAFIRCAEALPYGQVNHNRPTAGARSDQPFGGCGRSGNGRPAALAAGAIFADECVVW